MKERILTIIQALAIPERRFALHCGLKQNTLHDQLHGTSQVTLKTVMAILEAFPEISAEWLLRGVGEMKLAESPVMVAEGMAATINDLTATIQEKNTLIAMLHKKIEEKKNN
jgi:hypothetical protein